MSQIQLSFIPAFHADINSTRQTNLQNFTTRDEFDNSSHQLVAYNNNKLIGKVRMTCKQPSLLSKWLTKQETFPCKTQIANLTRGMIDKKWQRKSLYSLLMIELAIICYQKNYDYAITAIDKGKTEGFLCDLGYEVCRDKKQNCSIQTENAVFNNIILDLKKNIMLFLETRNKIVETLKGIGITIRSDY